MVWVTESQSQVDGVPWVLHFALFFFCTFLSPVSVGVGFVVAGSLKCRLEPISMTQGIGLNLFFGWPEEVRLQEKILSDTD